MPSSTSLDVRYEATLSVYAVFCANRSFWWRARVVGGGSLCTGVSFEAASLVAEETVAPAVAAEWYFPATSEFGSSTLVSLKNTGTSARTSSPHATVPLYRL